MTGCDIMKCKYWNGKVCSSKSEICIYQTNEKGVEQLQDEIEKLRGALKPFANFACDDWETHKCYNCIAKQALQGKKGG